MSGAARTFVLLGAVAAMLVLGGCGDGEDEPAAPAAPQAVEPAAVEPAAAPAVPAGGGNPVIEALELNAWYRAILVDQAAVSDPRELEAIARPYCEGLTVCRAAIWYDPEDLPRAMPIDADVLNTQAFALGRTTDGTENILWNCNLYPQFEAEHACLPRLMQF